MEADAHLGGAYSKSLSFSDLDKLQQAQFTQENIYLYLS